MTVPSTPAGYDAVTLVHWLWWKHRCHEGSPEDFQRLFEDVMKRRRPEFMPIRPYGNIGDRKCDGLFFHEGEVFQVYSPDELKQADVQAKIEADLAGAVDHWKDKGLKSWTFVYNCRRGLPPDIPGTLSAQKEKYPDIALGHLSSDALWEFARELTLQQRSELLGAPLGYEHLFLFPSGISGEAADEIRRGRFVVVHDVIAPINLQEAVRAIAPEAPLGPALHVRPLNADWTNAPREEWERAAAQQRAIVREALEKSRDLLPKFAIFSLAPVALAVHLGFLFSDRVEVRAFQYDRDRCVWGWPSGAADGEAAIQLDGLPKSAVPEPCEVALRISISARVATEDATTVANHNLELRVPAPSTTWLDSEARLQAAKKAIRGALASIRSQFPGCTRIHVLAAVPTPLAIGLGQAVNPRMDPEVAIYEYSRQRKPSYRLALTLRGDGS